MSIQQKQTKNYFNKISFSWEKRSNIKDPLLYDTIQHRNQYVLDLIRKKNTKNFLDVGCGSGELIQMSSNFTSESVGIDFSKQMINRCNKKKNLRKKNTKFVHGSFFNHKFTQKFDLISANGFIEYISLAQLDIFFKKCRKLLNKNGILVVSARNRLFNLFSLNDFTSKEIKKAKTLKLLLEESIKLNKLNLKEYLNEKQKIKFKKITGQPKTKIKVSLRHQFTPLQLHELLIKYKFSTFDLFPINYHPILPKKYSKNEKKIRKIANYFVKDNSSIDMIPSSSAFMISASCK